MTCTWRTIEQVMLLCALAACRESSPRLRPEIPPGFVAIAPPDSLAPTSYCAGYTELNWAPSIAPDGITLRIGPAMRGPADALDTDSIVLADGRLVALDMGEFGGGVTWIPAGAGDSTTIWIQNVMRLLRRGDAVVGVGGLAHFATDYGTILSFTRVPRGWQVDTVVDLGSAPLAIQTLGPDSLLVLTAKNVQWVDLRRRTRKIAHVNRQWSFAYPSSIVRDGLGHIYVGLRYAVARIEVRGGTTHEEWLVPASCPGFRVTGSIDDYTARCECIPPVS